MTTVRGDMAYRAYEMGREALEQGRHSEGIELLQVANKLAPHFKTLEVLGEALVAHGRTTDGIVALAASIGLARNQYRARYLLAKVFAGIEGRQSEALALANEALLVNPQYKAARELRDSLVAAGVALEDASASDE